VTFKNDRKEIIWTPKEMVPVHFFLVWTWVIDL